MFDPKAPFAKDAQKLQSYGTGGDTVLAHINPDEAKQLQQTKGMSVNPFTGLPSYGLFDSIGKALSSAAQSKLGQTALAAGEGYLTGGKRGAKAGAASSLLGTTQFGQTDIGKRVAGAIQGYGAGGGRGAAAGFLGAGGVPGAEGQGPMTQAQFATAIAQGQSLAEKAGKEAAAQTEELKKLGQPFIETSQEMLNRYKRGELTPAEKQAVDTQLAQAETYKGMAAPFTEQYKEALSRYQRGEMTPAEQAVFEEQAKIAGEYEKLATPFRQISEEQLAAFRAGKLRPDQEADLERQRTAAKQQIRQMGITDSSVLASYDRDIDNNYNAQRSALLQANLQQAQASFQQALVPFEQAMNARLGAAAYKADALSNGLTKAMAFYEKSLSPTEKGMELERNSRMQVVELLNKNLDAAIGLNSQGAGFVRDAIQLKLQSDAEISDTLASLMGTLASVYAESAYQAGGGVSAPGPQEIPGEPYTGGEPPGAGAGAGAPTGTTPQVSIDQFLGKGGGISQYLPKTAGLGSLGTLGGLTSTGFGATIPAAITPAGVTGLTSLSGGLAPSGSIASTLGGGMKGALAAGGTPVSTAAAVPTSAAGQAAAATAPTAAAPGATATSPAAAAARSPLGTATGVAATLYGAQQAYKGIQAGREGQAAAGGALAGAGGAYLLGNPATLAALGPAGLVAAGVAALAASLVNTKEFGDVALRNYWNAVESGRGIGQTPPEELAQGFINFYRTNKNEFPGQERYGRTGNEDFVYDMTQVINDAVTSGKIPAASTPDQIYAQVVKPWVDEMGPGPKDPKARAIMDFMMMDLINSYQQGKPISNAQVKGDKKFKIVSQKPVYPGTAAPTTVAPTPEAPTAPPPAEDRATIQPTPESEVIAPMQPTAAPARDTSSPGPMPPPGMEVNPNYGQPGEYYYIPEEAPVYTPREEATPIQPTEMPQDTRSPGPESVADYLASLQQPTTVAPSIAQLPPEVLQALGYVGPTAELGLME